MSIMTVAISGIVVGSAGLLVTLLNTWVPLCRQLPQPVQLPGPGDRVGGAVSGVSGLRHLVVYLCEGAFGGTDLGD